MAEVQVIKASEGKVNRRTGKVIQKLRVAAYCRVSTDSDEQLSSYNSQVTHYTDLIHKMKHGNLSMSTQTLAFQARRLRNELNFSE